MNVATLKAVGLALVTSGLSATALADKSIIAHGWDLYAATPEEVLANADAFAETGLDGVSVFLQGKSADGKPLSAKTILNDAAWSEDDFANQIPTLKGIVGKPGLSQSVLFCLWTPKKRLAWSDDQGWGRAANNMGVLAAIAGKCGYKGIMLDTEDYSQTEQFCWTRADATFEETAALARKRGAEVMKAMAAKNPRIEILAFWLLSLPPPTQRMDASTTLEETRETNAYRRDLWPAFVNGLLDELPLEGRLIDGDEHTYEFEASKGEFIRDAWWQRKCARQYVEEENRRKFGAQYEVSSGHYMDAYINKSSSRYYMGPVDGSRLLHLSANLGQATDAADSRVWLYGEKCTWIRWKGEGPAAKNYGGRQTWEEALPGLRDLLRRKSNLAKWLDERLAARMAAGPLTNIASNADCVLPSAVPGGFTPRIPKPFTSWQAEKKRQGEFGIDTSVGVGDASSLCAKGVAQGCLMMGIPDVKPGDAYRVEVWMKVQGVVLMPALKWQKGGKWDFTIPTKCLRFDGGERDGWRRASLVFAVPDGADTVQFLMSVAQEKDECAWFDRIAVQPL